MPEVVNAKPAQQQAQQTQPVQESQPVQEQKPVEQQESLITRVAKFKDESLSQTKEDDSSFDVHEIEQIADPKAKEYALKAYKSFERGYGKKFQDLAAMRKDYEQRQAELDKLKQQYSNWSPERIDELLKNPEFVEAAKKYQGIEEPDPKVKEVEKRIAQLEQERYLMELRRQDEQLSTKYPDYNSQLVNQVRDELITGRRQATNEDLWKVINFESAIERAYKLGLQDKKIQLNDKMNSSAIEGTTVSTAEEPLTRQDNENGENFLKRIFLKNLEKQSSMRK